MLRTTSVNEVTERVYTNISAHTYAKKRPAYPKEVADIIVEYLTENVSLNQNCVDNIFNCIRWVEDITFSFRLAYHYYTQLCGFTLKK